MIKGSIHISTKEYFFNEDGMKANQLNSVKIDELRKLFSVVADENAILIRTKPLVG
jgi:hypothetical protein